MMDNLKYQGLRKRMVAAIREKGVASRQILEVMEKIPRHIFIGKGFEEHAYEDKAFKIGAGQTISQPTTVAIMTSLLGPLEGKKILEVGTGSGYQSAVLCELGAKVYTIERQKLLYEKSKELLNEMGYRPRFFYGDGYKGLPAFAPFDGIIVTCGAPFVPEPLINQLIIGGKLVIPVGEDVQEMLVINKLQDGTHETEKHGSFRFVPMLEKRAR
jgi:protein-L-isoaspartate(D-aspartate) O-methyltransferase